MFADEQELIDVAELYRVFGDKTRVTILYTLTEDEKCVNDIATALNMTLSAVSHQLRILKQAHLVRYRRVGKNALYSLSDDHVRTILEQGLEHVRE
ncbi:MAG: helix-turn-helix transcriptional regulator [Ruminococcaceae bacterium]|jgi:ArsR family transcriptional regulator|nr:helix-turn-helix transcriptional regulator [Oscillospiraceae bacterium]MBQ7398647.1 helix-turn-helix transcriptional regulator [Clostridia bacterium]